MQEECELAPAEADDGAADGGVMVLGGLEVAAKQLGVDADQTPARHVERPPVGAEIAHIAVAPRGIDRRFAMTGRVLAIAQIVVAGKEAHRQADRVMQPPRRREIGLVRRAVERDVA